MSEIINYIGPTYYWNYGWSLGYNMSFTMFEFTLVFQIFQRCAGRGQLCPIENSVCILHKLNGDEIHIIEEKQNYYFT